MNEQVAKLLGYIGIALVLFGMGFGTAWEWQANAYGKVVASNEVGYKADLSLIITAAANQSRKSLADQQNAEQALAVLDTKNTQEKGNALAENETLRNQLSGSQAANAQLRGAVTAGDRRLRIAGRCPAVDTGSSDVPKTTSATSLGDATSVELSGEAGQSVFDIRADIIADQAALKALQEYATNVCQPGNAK